MKKNFKREVSIFLGIAMTPTLITGCNANETGAIIGESYTAIETPAIYLEDTIDEDVSLENVSTTLELENYLRRSILPSYEMEMILSCPEEYPKMKQMIAAYNNIRSFGYTLDDVKEELHNILVNSQVPRGLSDEEFDIIVGKLGITTTSNPFSVYLELAKAVHLTECNLEHEYTDYGVFLCPILMEEYNDKYREIPIGEYLDEKLINDEEYFLLKSMCNEVYDINRMVSELEALIELGFSEEKMDDETMNNTFAFLISTLDKTDNLLDRYMPLAIRVHNAMFPDDQITFNIEKSSITRERK